MKLSLENNKSIVVAVAATMLSLAILVPVGIAAQNTDVENTPTFQRQELSEEEREALKAEKQAEFEALIDEAVANGDLTSDQEALIDAIAEIRESDDSERPDRSELENLTAEERQELKEEKINTLIETLSSEYGIEVTQDDLTELKADLRDLGIGKRGGHGGPRGSEGRSPQDRANFQ